MPIDNVPDHVSTSSQQTTDSQPDVTSTSTIQPDPAVATIISPPRAIAKHATVFKSTWRYDNGRKRDWLSHVDGEGMYCKLCQTYDKRPFNRDVWNKALCTRIRLRSVVAHKKTEAHRNSVKLDHAENIQDAVSVVPVVSATYMEQAFACLYFLCQADIPHTTNFEPLLDLSAYLGVPTKANIRRGRNATYCSEKSVQMWWKVTLFWNSNSRNTFPSCLTRQLMSPSLSRWHS